MGANEDTVSNVYVIYVKGCILSLPKKGDLGLAKN